jgi:hypothetical protein
LKHDGFRAAAYSSDGECQLVSRNNKVVNVSIKCTPEKRPSISGAFWVIAEALVRANMIVRS